MLSLSLSTDRKGHTLDLITQLTDTPQNNYWIKFSNIASETTSTTIVLIMLCCFSILQTVENVAKHLQSDFPYHRYSKDEVGFGRWRALFPEVIYDRRAKQMTTVSADVLY